MQTITIQAVAKNSRKYQGATIWGVKVGQDAQGNDLWYNLYVTPKPSKGQSFNVEVTDTTGNDGRVFHDARIVGGAAPAAPASSGNGHGAAAPVAPVITNGGRATPYTQSFETFEAVARRAHSLAMELEPDPSQSRGRMAFVHTCLVALGEGKLTMTVEDEWGDTGSVAPAPQPAPVRQKQEKNAAHDHLTEVLNTAASLLKVLPPDLLAEKVVTVTGMPVKDVLYLTEKEAIQTRLVLEKIIDENTNWKAELSDRIKAYCLLKKIDFAKEKTDVLWAVASTRDFKSLDQAAAKKAVEALKEKYGG